MGRFETKRDAQKTKRVTSKQSGLQENKKDFFLKQSGLLQSSTKQIGLPTDN